MTTPKPPIVIFAAPAEQRAAWEPELRAAAARADLDWTLHMDPEGVPRETVDYMIFAANGPVRDWQGFTRLRAILNTWAGVESALRLNPPAEVPFVRMVEPGLTLGMIDYVVGHVCRHHIDIDRWIHSAPVTEWERDYPPLARDRTVAVLGLGALGRACAEKLAGLGFRVTGWARSPKAIAGVHAHHGREGLEHVLSEADILVLLLPHTPGTERLLGRREIAMLPKGACLVNAGRGPLIDHDALLAALDAGQIRHATMDVFDVEPLPPEHRYWSHPRVTVTPHIASVTRPETASEAIVARILTDLRGQPLPHVVDRSAGY